MNIVEKLKSTFVSKAYLKQETMRGFYMYKADQMTGFAMRSRERGVSDCKYCDYSITVSLTTYGKRLNEVYLAIESIMQGTWKPNRIILWLQDELKDAKLPTFLLNQVNRGLEIDYCKDIRSYKKLIPTLKKYPDEAVITIDDDVIYREDLVENLIKTHLEHKNEICANVVSELLIEGKSVKPFTAWPPMNRINEASPRYMGIGVGGILYPPHCFSDEIFNEDVFTSICRYADDVWFYSMGVINGRKTIKSFTHNKLGMDYYYEEDSQETSLSQINNVLKVEGGNDSQISAVFKKYNVFQYISER